MLDLKEVSLLDKSTSAEKIDGRVNYRPAKLYNLDVCADKENETIWLTQKDMAMLFDVSTDNIGLHIANILAEGELDNSTTEKSSVVQTEGKRQVKLITNLLQ